MNITGSGDSIKTEMADKNEPKGPIATLQKLPSFNRENFSRWDRDSTLSKSSKQPSKYLPTKEPQVTCQVITTERTNILLRYLHQQCERRQQRGEKRESEGTEGQVLGDHSNSTHGPSPHDKRKRMRSNEDDGGRGFPF